MERTSMAGRPQRQARSGRACAMQRAAFWCVFALVLWLGVCQGCAVGPDYVAPDIRMPDVWHQDLIAGLTEGEADFQTWWTTLDDPMLNSLIDRAAAGNLNLKQAVARIHESRARRGFVAGERFPDLDGSGTYQRTRASRETTPLIPPPLERTDNFYSTGLGATWEIDFWGRISRSIESADASLQASVEDYRDVLVLLYAEVAVSYVEVRALQARIRLARSNVDTQRNTLKLTQDRFNAELVAELDVRQAELNLASTESAIPTLQALLVRAVNRLGVLLGEHSGELAEELSQGAGIPKSPDRITVGLPVNLLRRRPDIRRSERQLAAQTARIGVATADLYPRFTLSGVFALEATEIDRSLNSSATAYSFGPSFKWNIFDGGRVRSNIRIEDALTEQALIGYEQTILLALEDVENAMAAYANETDRREALSRAVVAAKKSVALVVTLYKIGLTDFQNVLDMQRSLFAQQDKLAESEGLVTQNLIRLYRALGGGWRAEAAEPAAGRTGH